MYRENVLKVSTDCYFMLSLMVFGKADVSTEVIFGSGLPRGHINPGTAKSSMEPALVIGKHLLQALKHVHEMLTPQIIFRPFLFLI